jgi:hypothetical protein
MFCVPSGDGDRMMVSREPLSMAPAPLPSRLSPLVYQHFG